MDPVDNLGSGFGSLDLACGPQMNYSPVEDPDGMFSMITSEDIDNLVQAESLGSRTRSNSISDADDLTMRWDSNTTWEAAPAISAELPLDSPNTWVHPMHQHNNDIEPIHTFQNRQVDQSLASFMYDLQPVSPWNGIAPGSFLGSHTPGLAAPIAINSFSCLPALPHLSTSGPGLEESLLFPSNDIQNFQQLVWNHQNTASHEYYDIADGSGLDNFLGGHATTLLQENKRESESEASDYSESDSVMSYDSTLSDVSVMSYGSTTSHESGLSRSPPVVRDVRPADWERFKPIIDLLYLKDNMPLRELAAYMSSKHDFHPTSNQYKKQFRKWQWSKYNAGDAKEQPRRGRNRNDPACRRLVRPRARMEFMHRVNSKDGVLETALREFDTFFDAYSTQLATRNRPRGAPSYTSDIDIVDLKGLRVGISNLWRGNMRVGSGFYALTLRDISRKVRKFDVNVGLAVLWDVPLVMLKWNQWDLLERYLFSLASFSREISDSTPISAVALAMLALLRQCQYRFKQFLSRAMTVCSSRTPTRANAVVFEKEAYVSQINLGIYDGVHESTVLQLTSRLDPLIQEADAAAGHEAQTATIDLIMLQIEIQRRGHCWRDDWLRQVRFAESKICAMAGGRDKPFWEWTEYTQTFYLKLHTFVMRKHLVTDDLEAATVVARKLLDRARSTLNGNCYGLDTMAVLTETADIATFYGGMDQIAKEAMDLWRSLKQVRRVVGDVEQDVDDKEMVDT